MRFSFQKFGPGKLNLDKRLPGYIRLRLDWLGFRVQGLRLK
jgi:hypothetical protein